MQRGGGVHDIKKVSVIAGSTAFVLISLCTLSLACSRQKVGAERDPGSRPAFVQSNEKKFTTMTACAVRCRNLIRRSTLVVYRPSCQPPTQFGSRARHFRNSMKPFRGPPRVHVYTIGVYNDRTHCLQCLPPWGPRPQNHWGP